MPGTALAPPAAARPRRQTRPPVDTRPLCSICVGRVDVDGPHRPLRLPVANDVGAVRLGPYVHAGRCELALLTLETIRRGFAESTREQRAADELADVLLRLWRTGRGPDPADALAIIRARLAELGRRVDEPELDAA